jgi:hypothetical protein
MLGFLLVAAATCAEEIDNAIGKYRMERRVQSLYTTGFLTHLGGILALFAIALLVPASSSLLFSTGFSFSSASFPTLVPRVFLEVLLAHLSLRAAVASDRSTFGFLRTLSMPLLLLVDIVLGYQITLAQIVGIILIALCIGFLYFRETSDFRGSLLVLSTAMIAVMTTSLYKYDITHFNSVVAEQSIVIGAIIFYFLFAAIFLARENPLASFTRPIYFAQFLLGGVAHAAHSFSFVFLNASVAIAAKRSLAVLWTIFSGAMYFGEKHVVAKISAFIVLSIGIVLLVL